MNLVKKILAFTLIFMGLFTSLNLLDVNAETAPSKIKMKSKSSLYYYTEKKGTDYIGGYNFYRKQLTDGTYGYCVSNINTDVPGGKTLTSKGPITDKGLEYIIMNGYPHKSFTGNGLKDYYITQSAIWEYFDQTRGSHNWKTSFTSSSSGMKKYVYTLVKNAKVAKNAANQQSSVSISTNNTNMSLSSDKGYFVSNVINVNMTNTKDTYTVNLVTAPNGTIIKSTNGQTKTTFSKGEGFVVYVPTSSVSNGAGKVVVSVSAQGVTNRIYYYTTGNSKYQKIAPVTVYEEITNLTSNQITLNFVKQVTKVKISKQDITSKSELPGAKLEIKDKNGKVVASWISESAPHYIEGLAEGEYTLTETTAPKGYVKSEETIKFTLTANGVESIVVMYNSKEKETTKYKISKQDITSKEELPGAKLEIKDKNGKVVDSWVSGNEPHFVTNLGVGEYTLSETTAPDGYTLSTETIKFTVKKDGQVKTVVMYNAPKSEETKVKISKQDITSKEELPGAKLEIKDKNGEVVESWVSGTTPHYIEGLEPGDYTLTETTAPDGYKLSSETIEFTVKDDGSVTSVVMYNSKLVEVPITDLNVSLSTIVGAALMILIGTGLVFYAKRSY